MTINSRQGAGGGNGMGHTGSLAKGSNYYGEKENISNYYG